MLAHGEAGGSVGAEWMQLLMTPPTARSSLCIGRTLERRHEVELEHARTNIYTTQHRLRSLDRRLSSE